MKRIALVSGSFAWFMAIAPLACQAQGLVVFSGDSHTDGTGTDRAHAWPVQLMRLIGDPRLGYLNVARAGGTMAEQLALWQQAIHPALASATGARLVFAMGGYNDVSRYGATAQTVVSLLVAEAGRAHADGSGFICGIDVIRFDASGRLNGVIAQVSDMIRADHSFCDGVVDFQANPLFARQAGPYPSPPFAADHGVHLDASGQADMAAMALPVFRNVLAGRSSPGR